LETEPVQLEVQLELRDSCSERESRLVHVGSLTFDSEVFGHDSHEIIGITWFETTSITRDDGSEDLRVELLNLHRLKSVEDQMASLVEHGFHQLRVDLNSQWRLTWITLGN